MNNYTKEELEEVLNNYTNEDIYQNMIIRLPDGTGAPLQEIQNRYNDLVNEETVEETVDIESMSIDELLDLYSKNVNRKSEINSRANSLFSYGITSEELTEIFNIDNLQTLIVNEIKRKYDLSESFRNMTDEELLSLRVTASSDLERLTAQVMDSGEAATNTDENLKNQLLEQIKDIDNEINFRKKQVELREKMLKILNNQNIDINTLDKINPNDPQLQLDENEIDLFIFEKNKLDLMNDIFTNRELEETKEVINSNKENKEIDSLSIEELLNLYVKNLERIDDLNFKGDLSLDEKNALQDLKNSQNQIKEILNDKLSLNEELKDLSIEELNNLKDKTYDDLSNLINPVMDSGMAADNEDLALKDKLTERLKEIASELEYRNLQEKIKQRMCDMVNQAVDINGNVVTINNISKEEIDKIDPNSVNFQLDQNEKDLFKNEKEKLNLLNEIRNSKNNIIKEDEENKKDNIDDFGSNEIVPLYTKENENEENDNNLLPPPEDNNIEEEPKEIIVENREIITATFMNSGKVIPNYFEIKVPLGEVIHGPVIDPVPLNSKGKPKKITAKEFDCWVDQDGNVVDLSKPLERNVILTAQYKFNKKKAVAVGLGAAVGTAAYIADLAVPTPVPVVSMVGAAGFGLGAKFQGKNLKNLQADVISQANEITAFDEIPEELLEEIEETKKSGYLNTFLKTAAIACTISSTAHGIKNRFDAANNANITSQVDQTQVIDTTTNVNPNPTVDPSITSTDPTSFVGPQAPDTSVTDVFGGYTPKGHVFKTAEDALNNVGGLNPYTPAFNGNETFEVLYNGMRYPIEKGQSISSILESIGATDPSQVAVNVMNADGVPLTWQSLADLTVQGAEKVANIIK